MRPIFALALHQIKLDNWPMHLIWWHGITHIPHLLLESSTSWSWWVPTYSARNLSMFRRDQRMMNVIKSTHSCFIIDWSWPNSGLCWWLSLQEGYGQVKSDRDVLAPRIMWVSILPWIFAVWFVGFKFPLFNDELLGVMWGRIVCDGCDEDCIEICDSVVVEMAQH